MAKIFTLHGVLDWGTRQQQAVAAVEAKKCLPPDTGRVLDVLCFVQDHVLPLDPLEVLLVLRYLLKKLSQ